VPAGSLTVPLILVGLCPLIINVNEMMENSSDQTLRLFSDRCTRFLTVGLGCGRIDTTT